MIWIVAYALAAIVNAFRLRHRWAWAQRINDANWRLLTLIDEVAAFLIFGLLYILCLFPRMPMLGDTISSLCWAGELAGVRWCMPFRVAIDALFRLLTSQRHHCRTAYTDWTNPLGRVATAA